MDQKAIVNLLSRLRTVNEDFFSGRRPVTLDVDYDEHGDVIYIAFDAPRPAIGVSADAGMIIRYDPETFHIVGFTITSFKRYFLERYPEFCFLLPGTPQRQPPHPASAAALSRTTATLMTSYVAA
jgi:hypothetical protein